MPVLKPAPGRTVRDPKTLRFLPEEGRDVPLDQFWRRRLRDGDVVQAEAPAATHAPAPPPISRGHAHGRD